MTCPFKLGDEVRHISAGHFSGEIIDISGPFGTNNRYLINIKLHTPYEEPIYDDDDDTVIDVEVFYEWQTYSHWFELVKPRVPKKSGFGRFSKGIMDKYNV